MQPNEDDMARLWDMLDAARAIKEFIHEKRFDWKISVSVIPLILSNEVRQFVCC